MVTNRNSKIIQYEFVTYLLNYSQILQNLYEVQTTDQAKDVAI